MRDQLNSNAFFLQLLNLNAGGKQNVIASTRILQRNEYSSTQFVSAFCFNKNDSFKCILFFETNSINLSNG